MYIRSSGVVNTQSVGISNASPITESTASSASVGCDDVSPSSLLSAAFKIRSNSARQLFDCDRCARWPCMVRSTLPQNEHRLCDSDIPGNVKVVVQ
jgi:hypothetical protein